MAKILHVGDLHFKHEWFAWIDANAHRFDLVCLSGDFLEMGNDLSLSQQVVWFAAWLEAFQRHGIPLALCSGNHDVNPLDDANVIPPELLSRFLATPNWTDALKSKLVIVDQENRVPSINNSNMIITTLPYHDEDMGLRQRTKALWNEASRLRAQLKFPWIVLAHVPPSDSCIGDIACDQDLRRQIEDRQPDYVLVVISIPGLMPRMAVGRTKLEVRPATTPATPAAKAPCLTTSSSIPKQRNRSGFRVNHDDVGCINHCY